MHVVEDVVRIYPQLGVEFVISCINIFLWFLFPIHMFYLCDVIVDQFHCLIFLIQRSHHEQLSLEELQKYAIKTRTDIMQLTNVLHFHLQGHRYKFVTVLIV